MLGRMAKTKRILALRQAQRFVFVDVAPMHPLRLF
jgi:hypothetical protein